MSRGARQNTISFGSMDDAIAHMRRPADQRFNDGRIYAPSIAPEREVLPTVLEMLRRHPLVAWAQRQNTAAGYLIDFKTHARLVAEGALRKNEARFMQFGWKGQLDITSQLRDGRRLDVEVKRADGKATPDQQATIDAVNGARGVAFVARGADDVVRELERVK